MKKTFECPICKTSLKRDNEYFPFCSKRCQTIDLSHWADGSYHIAGEPVPDHESDEGHSIH